jgi:hypothetical protein
MFHRLSMDVDLTGLTSALAIELALKEARSISKAKYKICRTEAVRERHGKRAEFLDVLIEHDFGSRAIFESRVNPTGSIALTLKYGRQEADRIIAQRRAEMRMRIPCQTVPRAPTVPARRMVLKKPWFRRIPTHRK